jgi:hypothetical protein
MDLLATMATIPSQALRADQEDATQSARLSPEQRKDLQRRLAEWSEAWGASKCVETWGLNPEKFMKNDGNVRFHHENWNKRDGEW